MEKVLEKGVTVRPSSGGEVAIKRALVSVSNKDGIVAFTQVLADLGVEIISTGGTARALMEAGLPVTSVSEVTDFPEMLEGRVKTLHPHIHGALLAKRDQESHMRALSELGIKPIDMVVVNLYPFAETVARPGVTLDEAVEEIDIGGPTMIRSAAKNFDSVAVITDAGDYPDIAAELQAARGMLSAETRRMLAQKAFAHTATYDGLIAEFLGGGRESYPSSLHLSYRKLFDLRYGENPHQSPAWYRDPSARADALANAVQIQGKELSYNNIVDTEAAWLLVREWGDRPAAAIIKHTNPSGVAVRDSLTEAFEAARECDPVSAFGGIVAYNRPVDLATAKAMEDLFVEVVIAPDFEERAVELFSKKEGLRLLQLPIPASPARTALRAFDGGMLVQKADASDEGREAMKVLTEREPSEDEWRDLLFAWKVARNVKSNAIVLAKGEAAVGVGAGQMSRVDSSWIALRKAGDRAKGAVLASDAFFPFPDALEIAVEAGVTAAVQPGGSIRDEEVISAANTRGAAMVATGFRHFRH